MEKKIYRATRRNRYRTDGILNQWREMQQKHFFPRKTEVVDQYRRLGIFLETMYDTLPLTWHLSIVRDLRNFWASGERTRPVSRIIRELKTFDNDPQRRYTNSALVVWANQVRRGLRVNSLEALAGTPEKI